MKTISTDPPKSKKAFKRWWDDAPFEIHAIARNRRITIARGYEVKGRFYTQDRQLYSWDDRIWPQNVSKL